jgi:bifunctional DNase/RNase
MAEVRVVGIRVEQPANQPVLLLRESTGDRYLPIWIGQTEANAIILEQQGVEPARPLTHDLFRDVIGALGHSLKEVRIVDLQEGTFYADLIFDHDVRVSARPSDSVAIALRMGVPIHVEESVLDAAGLLIPDENDEESTGVVREDEVEKFKEFPGRLQGRLTAPCPRLRIRLISVIAAPTRQSVVGERGWRRPYFGCDARLRQYPLTHVDKAYAHTT